MSTEQGASRSDIEKVVARAIEDEGFRKRLGEDPEGTIAAEGYTLSVDEMAAVRQNVDPDLSQEQLEDRVSKAALPTAGVRGRPRPAPSLPPGELGLDPRTGL